jgi:hypothetical protein
MRDGRIIECSTFATPVLFLQEMGFTSPPSGTWMTGGLILVGVLIAMMSQRLFN